MCSINDFNFVNEELINKMNPITKHRGPDDSGVFMSREWSRGHNRFSIIDLNRAGHQPMLSSDKKLAMVFNGEIYNFKDIKKELAGRGYKFVSKTDTAEVVLYAYQEWKKECLQKFNGMFALSILDTTKEELFIARDRIEIKPFYYYSKGGKFIFSSEVKAILQHKIDTPIFVKPIDFMSYNMNMRMLFSLNVLTEETPYRQFI